MPYSRSAAQLFRGKHDLKTSGLRSVIRDICVAVIRKLSQTFHSVVTILEDGSEYPLIIFKLSFVTIKLASYANKIFMLVRNKKYENIYWVYVINLIPNASNNHWYNLIDLISSLVNENNGYSQILAHIRRVYDNRSKLGCRIVKVNLKREIWSSLKSSLKNLIIWIATNVLSILNLQRLLTFYLQCSTRALAKAYKSTEQKRCPFE